VLFIPATLIYRVVSLMLQWILLAARKRREGRKMWWRSSTNAWKMLKLTGRRWELE
jgi:hypothetical protein